MRNRILELAKKEGADLIGFAPASRFESDDPIFKLLPETGTVIGLAFRILRGACRGIEEGSSYFQYATMGIETPEETIMPMVSLKIANLLESEGYTALPQRRHGQIVAGENDTTPEIAHWAFYRGKSQEIQINFEETAVKCGLGERGLHGSVLSDKFGPLMRYCFVLTDAELEETPMYTPHLCDQCGKCVAACPGRAIAENGELDKWQCEVYYIGANGKYNPFMPPNAYADFEDRMEIIAGEARMTPERAKKVMKETFFYPSIQHSYQSCICGKACDMACYMHLEEQGKLTGKFKTLFRKREKWEFSLDDYR